MRSECLLEADEATRVDVRVRFLHVVERKVMRRGPDGLQAVDELTVAGTRHLSWDEAVEREVVIEGVSPLEAPWPQGRPIEVPSGDASEELGGGGGTVGVIVRSWRTLAGLVEVSAERLDSGLVRMIVWIHNSSPYRGDDREEALRQTFVSTHTALQVTGGAFVSLTDPPDGLHAAAESCRNTGTWPVLVGAPGERHTILSSPIILQDYPEVAEESPGDLFDGAEIDGLLTLGILSLTDEEKREMRDSDPRAREILERTESLSQEELMRLHGAVREVQVRP
jgi:hypothetical protein